MSKKSAKTQEELLKEALVPVEEQPYAVPENWVWVKLGGIIELVYGKSLPNSQRSNSGYPVFGSNGIVGYHDEFLIEGPVIVVGRKGSHGEVNWFDESGWAIDTTYYVKTKIESDYRFIYFLLRTLNLKKLNRSTAIPGLNREDAYNEYVPLPPLNEQKRIADKVERLLDKINQAKQLIEEAKETFELRRAAILDEAFRGELTKKWRVDSAINETGSELLMEIKEDIELTNKKKLKFKSGDSKEIFNIPNTWAWGTLENVCYSISDGDHQAPPKVERGIPFLVISNINKGQLNLETSRFVPREYYNSLQESRVPRKGDILYSVVGSIGIPVLVDEDVEFCFQRHIAILKPSKLINNKYLYYVMKSRLVYNQAIESATGTAQLTVPLRGLRNIMIPIPPVTEQKIIVEMIERVIGSSDSSQEVISEVLANRISTIKQSILSKAFRGELDTNEQSDENAIKSLLLEYKNQV